MNNSNQSKTSHIGEIYELKRPMLGMPIGALGYVFNEYEDFDGGVGMGLQIIFENGSYDGFSIEEQHLFLTFIGYQPAYANYKFENVMDVYRNYNKGYWKW